MVALAFCLHVCGKMRRIIHSWTGQLHHDTMQELQHLTLLVHLAAFYNPTVGHCHCTESLIMHVADQFCFFFRSELDSHYADGFLGQ